MPWPKALGGPAGRGLCRRRWRTAVLQRRKGFAKAGGPSRRMRRIGTSLSNTWRKPRRGETAVHVQKFSEEIVQKFTAK